MKVRNRVVVSVRFLVSSGNLSSPGILDSPENLKSPEILDSLRILICLASGLETKAGVSFFSRGTGEMRPLPEIPLTVFSGEVCRGQPRVIRSGSPEVRREGQGIQYLVDLCFRRLSLKLRRCSCVHIRISPFCSVCSVNHCEVLLSVGPHGGGRGGCQVRIVPSVVASVERGAWLTAFQGWALTVRELSLSILLPALVSSGPA